MIRTLHRARGASALGASRPGDVGPFGLYGADEDDLDDGQDDEQHDDKGWALVPTPGGDQDRDDT